jgi:hypothetical protein
LELAGDGVWPYLGSTDRLSQFLAPNRDWRAQFQRYRPLLQKLLQVCAHVPCVLQRLVAAVKGIECWLNPSLLGTSVAAVEAAAFEARLRHARYSLLPRRNVLYAWSVMRAVEGEHRGLLEPAREFVLATGPFLALGPVEACRALANPGASWKQSVPSRLVFGRLVEWT